MYQPRLGEQFETLGKQAHAARFAMWIFLGSEILLFAGLFALYTAYRVMYSADFVAGVNHNDIVLGSVNTVVLITSSFTVAMAIHAARVGRPEWITRLLVLTLLMGVAFLTIKGLEYQHHFAEGVFPGKHYSYAALDTYGARTFFTLYFFMSGLHAIHVILGLAVLGWLAWKNHKTPFGPEHYLPLDLGALYWHLVDVMWIFLWPLLYLTR